MKKTFLFLIFYFSFFTSAYSLEKLFYLTNDIANYEYLSSKKLSNISNHAEKMDILAPQIYEVNAHGNLWGNIDQQLIKLAAEKKLRIMPLVINSGFNQETMHTFLGDIIAQERAINTMVKLAKQYHFYGWQFDFENINSQDKKAYTEFFKRTAEALHQHNFAISIAIVPHASEELSTDYDRWIHENWSGAFDYKELGKIADFVTLMSYDNHTSLTTPGPIAPLHWVEKTLQHVLKEIPPQKISLGIPAYSGYWTTGKMSVANAPEKYSFRGKESQVSYENAKALIAKFSGTPIWNAKWQSAYSILENNNKIDYVFLEDEAAFKAKLQLVQKYHLRGFSVWQLGMEDTKIWKSL